MTSTTQEEGTVAESRRGARGAQTAQLSQKGRVQEGFPQMGDVSDESHITVRPPKSKQAPRHAQFGV